jgi:hypothetical protein
MDTAVFPSGNYLALLLLALPNKAPQMGVHGLNLVLSRSRIPPNPRPTILISRTN